MGHADLPHLVVDIAAQPAKDALLPRAQMAELVDAPASGAGARKGVEVRVLFWAPSLLKLLKSLINRRLDGPKSVSATVNCYDLEMTVRAESPRNLPKMVGKTATANCYEMCPELYSFAVLDSIVGSRCLESYNRLSASEKSGAHWGRAMSIKR